MPQCPRSARRAGFTLIELLVVVAIISILASIALPNFMEAMTRAKVARVKSDLRTIATAMETFAVDHNRYPAIPDALGPRYQLLCPLTTPISYMSEIPHDPFHSTDPKGVEGWRAGMYAYGGSPRPSPFIWILGSDGPDRVMNTDPEAFASYSGFGKYASLLILYDPTNGTTSAGDIIRASDRTGS